MVQAQNPAQRGYTLLETIVGIGILAAIMVALGQSALLQSRSTARFADQRAAVALAERTLTALQTRTTLPEKHAWSDYSVRVLETPGPAGCHWIDVTARHGQATSTLTGIADAKALAPLLEKRP